MRPVPVAFALVLLVGLGPAAAFGPAAAAESNYDPGPAPPLASTAGGSAVQTPSGSAVQTADGSAAQAVHQSATRTANATLSGTVTTGNGSAVGDAAVLVGSRAFFEKASPSELRQAAADDPEDVAVTETDADGTYSLTVGEDVDAEAVVAVSPAGVSRVRSFEAGEMDLTIQTTKPLELQLSDENTEPGGRTTVEFRLKNTDDVAVEGLQVSLGKLPEGWNVVSGETESGSFSSANRTFTWNAVEPGEWVGAEVRLFVAIDAERTTHELPVFATSGTHDVAAGNVSVTVAYPGDGPSETATAEDAGDDSAVDTPGFGPVVALAALLGVTLLLARRE